MDDIVLLLSLFTGRAIFKLSSYDARDFIYEDHRIYNYGRELARSIEFKAGWKNRETGTIETNEQNLRDFYKVNIGFEKGLNKILELVSSSEWQREYENGYFLFLFNAAMKSQFSTTSFILCWTVWEHIFAIKNKKWLSEKTIEKMSGIEKISFILTQYFFKEITGKNIKNIERLNRTRNRLIHFGKKADSLDYKEIELFILLTEQLIAIILGLKPPNIFNSSEELEVFLNTESRKGKIRKEN